MAAARQKEMNESATVVATTTLRGAGAAAPAVKGRSFSPYQVTLKFACEVS